MDQKSKAKASPRAQTGKTTRTQAALRDALLSLLEEQALEQITVREITARAGVGYATFFRRYTDKEALLHDLAADEIARLEAMTLPIFYTVDSLASTQALCAYVWEHRKVWAALLAGGAAAAMKEECLRRALLVQEKLASELWVRSDLAVTFTVTSLLEILAWWLKQDEPPSVQEMAEVVNRLAVMPVFS